LSGKTEGEQNELHRSIAIVAVGLDGLACRIKNRQARRLLAPQPGACATLACSSQ
jgi:hypothetical protein